MKPARMLVWTCLGLWMALPLFAGTGNFVLRVQKSADGLSGWANVPVEPADLVSGGGIYMPALNPGETAFYRLDIVEVDAIPYTGLVINEVDYDQPGLDYDEFVEIYNGSSIALDMSQFRLVFINGASLNEYLRIDLTPGGILPPGGYLVVCSQTVVLAPSAPFVYFSLANDNIQNGAPDGVALISAVEEVVVDALSYEGSIPNANITGWTTLPGPSLVEGNATTASDSSTSIGSLSRLPNGNDTNDANTDWVFSATPTPGAPNVP